MCMHMDMDMCMHMDMCMDMDMCMRMCMRGYACTTYVRIDMRHRDVTPRARGVGGRMM